MSNRLRLGTSWEQSWEQTPRYVPVATSSEKLRCVRRHCLYIDLQHHPWSSNFAKLVLLACCLSLSGPFALLHYPHCHSTVGRAFHSSVFPSIFVSSGRHILPSLPAPPLFFFSLSLSRLCFSSPFYPADPRGSQGPRPSIDAFFLTAAVAAWLTDLAISRSPTGRLALVCAWACHSVPSLRARARLASCVCWRLRLRAQPDKVHQLDFLSYEPQIISHAHPVHYHLSRPTATGTFVLSRHTFAGPSVRSSARRRY